MTEAERRLWLQVQRAIARMRPDLASAIEHAWEQVRASLPPTTTLRDLIAAHDVDGLARAVLSDDTAGQAFARARDVIRDGVAQAAERTEARMPGTVKPEFGVRFDALNPDVVRAIQRLESETLGRLTTETRETVRQVVQRGIEQGVSPIETARQLRSVIGLTPAQEQIVDNYRRELLGERIGNPLDRALRDRRFDARTARGELTPAQVEQQVEAYRRRMVNHSSKVYANTVSAEAQRIGGQASWKAAAEGLEGATVMKTWVHSSVPIEPRPEHLALDGTSVPIDLPYPNGDMYPGEHDPWNCFAEGTAVEGAFLVGLKAAYSGPMRELVTARGYRLTVTSNHPVLTDHGWVGAGALRVGDCLFSKKTDVDGIASVGIDHQHRPAAVEDVLNALGAQRTLPTGVAVDLHGDASSFVGDVHVVGADGIFAHERRYAANDLVNDRGLPSAASDGAALEHGQGSAFPFMQSTPSPLGDGPSLTQQSLGGSAVVADALPAQFACFGTAAHWDATVPQVFGDGTASVAAFLLELQQASAFAIASDQIISVRDFHAESVHVYDLQSRNGWLLASNIVCSNCRCVETYSVKYDRAVAA